MPYQSKPKDSQTLLNVYQPQPAEAAWLGWINSPLGRYVLAWEQTQLDHAVADVFGYHALQLGLPQLDALRENRMPYCGLVLDATSCANAPYHPPIYPIQPSIDAVNDNDTHENQVSKMNEFAVAVPSPRSITWCDFPELPFKTQSIDLLVLPHTLEFTHNPHHLLREAERLLLPEGRLIILSFNTLSLWGIRQSFSKLTHRPFVPTLHHFIAFSRLKDWMKLLGFEISRGHFGCYRFPVSTAPWVDRCAFMENLGQRWWPVFGAVYMLTAIKRIRGIRLVGPKPVKAPALPVPLAPAASSSHTPYTAYTD